MANKDIYYLEISLRIKATKLPDYHLHLSLGLQPDALHASVVKMCNFIRLPSVTVVISVQTAERIELVFGTEATLGLP